MAEDKKYKVEIDNLAIPEIKTGEVDDEFEEEVEEEISYDNLAIPEINIIRKK